MRLFNQQVSHTFIQKHILLGGMFIAILGGITSISTQSNASETAVPITQVFKENQGKFECISYRSSDDSCFIVGTSELKDSTIFSVTEMLVNPEPRITFIISGTMAIKQDMGCMDYSSVQFDVVGTDDENMKNTILNALKASLQAYGTVCVTYYKKGENTYTVKTVNTDNQPVAGIPPMETSFHDQKKALRASQ